MKKTKILTLGMILITLTACSQKHVTVVNEGDKQGLINQDGYVVIKPKYKQMQNFDGSDDFRNHPHLLNFHWIHDSSNEAYTIVQNINNKYGVINQKGRLLLKQVYDSVTYFFNGFMRIEIGGKYGLVNRDFEIVLKPIYDEIGEFTDNIAILQNNNKYGCINKDMEIKVKPTYDKIYFQQESFLRTTLNNKWGYLDNECNIISKPVFDYAYDFSNGIAKVLLNKNISYLNDEGELLSEAIFKEDSSSF